MFSCQKCFLIISLALLTFSCSQNENHAGGTWDEAGNTFSLMVKDKNGGMKPEVYDGCIGCGVCEELCPASEPAIVIKPRLSFKQYYEEGIRL